MALPINRNRPIQALPIYRNRPINRRIGRSLLVIYPWKGQEQCCYKHDYIPEYQGFNLGSIMCAPESTETFAKAQTINFKVTTLEHKMLILEKN